MRRPILISLAALAVLAAPGHASAACKTIAVTKAAVSYPHETTIQAAVNKAKPCDWVLIAPGVYTEKVVVKTPRLHIRGLNRNTVIVDGRHMAANGIEVLKADGVWIENLTVRDFDRKERDEEDEGNAIYWNGGEGSGRIGLHGWYGTYLTAYNTGLLGGYGLFAVNAVTGSWDHVYASGFNDSGLYIGACRDCKATVSHALVERNALGYSGTNAGGHLIVEDSVFRNNAVGVGPSSLPGDPPPPQLGTCDSGKNRSPTPKLTTTKLARCTIFRRNTITGNNNLSTPANETTLQLPWGVGVALIGTYGDLFADNVVTGNANFGILGFENPVPFPPTDKTIFFQLAGNRIEGNKASGAKHADLALLGGLFGEKASVNNCFEGNTAKKTMPADLSPWSCSLATTPNPDAAATAKLLGIVLQLQGESLARKMKGQPAPRKQETMPEPCKGVPATPLCR